jgi:hypothetical protein
MSAKSPHAGKSLEPVNTMLESRKSLSVSRGNDLGEGKSVTGLDHPQELPKLLPTTV